jgi:hypothetical protein
MIMSRVYCPNCGSEVKLPETSSVGIGMTISKESRGDYALPLETVRNNNVSNNTTNNVEKKENGIMNNMNGFDMEALAKMVAAQLSGQNVQAQTVVKNSPNVDITKLNNSDTIDRNHWAENSQFYGKEICGYAYNPYMIRRFLPAQFNQLIHKYNGNVHRGITLEYPYMYSVKYTLEEVRKLAMLQKRDKIAFDERKYVFTLRQCKTIFTEYVDAVIAHLLDESKKFVMHNKVGKEYHSSIKGFGWFKAGVVAEKIVNHKVVKYLEKTEEFERVFIFLNDLKEKINRCYSYKELYETMPVANKLVKVPENTKKSKDFMDCFIKAGSYYTLKQQLMFNQSVCFKGEYGRSAVIMLRGFLERGYEGYKIYAMLKKVNNIR